MKTDEELISKYFAVTKTLDRMNEEHNAKTKPYSQALTAIKGELHVRLNERGTTSTKSEDGVCFKVEHMKCTVDDRMGFMRFCMSDPDMAMALLTSHVSKEGVRHFMEAHGGEAPPGVAVGYTVDVTIRRK